MDYIKNNEIFARFLDWELLSSYDNGNDFYRTTIDIPTMKYDLDSRLTKMDSTDRCSLVDMKFKIDWNWLMKIVDKIESLRLENGNDRIGVFISSNSCTIQSVNFDPSCEVGQKYYWNSVTLDTKIESTFVACKMFIEHYNKQSG